jgi:hypothetical protein
MPQEPQSQISKAQPLIVQQKQAHAEHKPAVLRDRESPRGQPSRPDGKRSGELTTKTRTHRTTTPSTPTDSANPHHKQHQAQTPQDFSHRKSRHPKPKPTTTTQNPRQRKRLLLCGAWGMSSHPTSGYHDSRLKTIGIPFTLRSQ